MSSAPAFGERPAFTVIVPVAVPVQPAVVPVTEYVVVTAGVAVIDEVTAPVDQLYEVAPEAVIVPAEPGHTLVEVDVTTGFGLTVTVYVAAGPVHPASVAVTEMVAVMGEAVVLVAVKEGVLPAPLAARPMEGSELVHAKVAPAGVLVNADAATAPPLQTVMFAGTVVVGLGFTVTVPVPIPVQPPVVPVTV